MKVTDRILNRIAKRLEPYLLRSNPIAPLTVYSKNLRDFEPPPFDTRSHLLVYLANTWCYACIRAIAEWVSDIPLLVQKQQKIDGKEQWITQEEHPLLDLIKYPNPDNSQAELFNDWVVSLLAAGDGYLIYTPEDRELWHCQSDWIKIQVNDFGQIQSYRIANRGQSFSFEKAHIIHARLANPTSGFYGLPPSMVVRKTILTQMYLAGYIEAYFLNNALMGSIFSTDQPLDEPQKEYLRKEIKRLYTGHTTDGESKAFTTAIFDRGAKLDKISHAIKDLMPVDLYKMMREEIVAAYGLTHIMLSVLDDASYANAKIARKVFVENRGLPTLRLLEDALNMRLSPQFGNDIRLHFNRSAISALQEDENEKAKRYGLLYHTDRIITLNEARIPLGLPPDDEIGDEYFQGSETSPFGAMNLRGVEKPFVITDRTEGNYIDLNSLSIRSDEWWSQPPEIKRRYAHHVRVVRYEKAYEKLIKQFFNEQRERIIDSLNKITSGGRYISQLYWQTRDEPKLPNSNIDPIMDFEFENEQIKKATVGLIGKIVSENGKSAVKEIKADFVFDMKSPEIQLMFEQFGNRITNINNVTYEEIKAILKQGYDEGVGIGEIEKRIRDKFSEFNRVRSTRIARTEMNGLVNGAHNEGYRQAGVTHKQWMPAYLPTSRDTHIEAGNLSPIPLNEPFPVGNALLDYPGDPSGPPEEIINCYCTLKPTVSTELSYSDSDNGHKNRIINLTTKGEHTHA